LLCHYTKPVLERWASLSPSETFAVFVVLAVQACILPA